MRKRSPSNIIWSPINAIKYPLKCIVDINMSLMRIVWLARTLLHTVYILHTEHNISIHIYAVQKSVRHCYEGYIQKVYDKQQLIWNEVKYNFALSVLKLEFINWNYFISASHMPEKRDAFDSERSIYFMYVCMYVWLCMYIYSTVLYNV